MKSMSLLAALVLLVASATFVMAGPHDKGGGMKPGWGMEDSILSKLDLTSEQLEKIRILRESFLKDMTPLRSQLFEKRAEIRLLWMQIKLDPVKIKALEKEAHNLKGQLNEKSTDYRLSFRDILTPEQSLKFVALAGARGPRHHRGKGGRGDDFPRSGHPPRR
jgi:Spy/CpxP family protein refolding chaperone